ncbi:General transcription factor II-I repeat domain-containing protein 2B [Eumeta japonica]|uniref:General transcription factor II-I repeat domain-containing protein 2B n=1 Tax=Eumeta variegata TaxID=151549 RepID=A0A4C1U7E0_EUMVA|nr:General transcription factor II-I repeat domain-containing protein 2B [Eumeta japonica]
MANDIKTTLTERLAGSEQFSIVVDESTDLSDTAEITILIRGVDKKFTVTEELLALQPLKGPTTGEDTFVDGRTLRARRAGAPSAPLNADAVAASAGDAGLAVTR